MEEQKSIKELLTELKAKQDAMVESKQPETKGWKLPWKARVSNANARKNYTTICVIKDNLQVDFIKQEISDGTITIDGLPRVATADHIMHYKGKPFMIMPYWDTKPFSPVNSYDESLKDKTNIAGRRLILSKLEKEAIKPKGKGGGMMMWIIIGIVVLAAGYYFLKGGSL